MLVVVGRIGRPHGVKGAATIEVRTDEPDKRFAVGARLLTDSGLELTVASADLAQWPSPGDLRGVRRSHRRGSNCAMR